MRATTFTFPSLSSSSPSSLLQPANQPQTIIALTLTFFLPWAEGDEEKSAGAKEREQGNVPE